MTESFLGFQAALVFAAAFAVYAGTALWVGNVRSPRLAYFDHLADAFLHGRAHLSRPPAVHDLTFRNGRWYVPFPPLPALILLPWIAWRGVERVSTPLVSCATGASAVTFVYLLLSSLATGGWTGLSMADNLWLTLFFACSTALWWVSVAGAVWYFAQTATVTFVALSVWLTVATGSPWTAGAALGLAMLGRPHVALSWPLLVGAAADRLALAPGGFDLSALAVWGACSAVPLLAAVAALLLYNRIRFGSLLDFGYKDELVATGLKGDLQAGGQFNPRFAGRNLWYMLLAPPRREPERRRLVPDPMGMGLLLTTPALVWLCRGTPWSGLAAGAWIAAGLVVLPVVTYYATGWWQFGARFSLDFLVPLTVLLSLAARGGTVPWLAGLIAAGVLVNVWGVRWFFDPESAPPGSPPRGQSPARRCRRRSRADRGDACPSLGLTSGRSIAIFRMCQRSTTPARTSPGPLEESSRSTGTWTF